ncbi:glycosyltransferase [uncultured Sphingomonas sp.]|uniref:glycosyltransferase n=1 Tax=uncultured Sphingomonas sp. TaxID=158754 RepID=UPI0025D3F748|nr:glycosyltransferase [uncultured Sphingomonas sp.]
MRIVEVNELYSPTGGGVKSYVDAKLAIMARQGHELIVIAPGRTTRIEERPAGGRVIYVKSPTIPIDRNYGLFWDAAPIHALLDELQPDVVENCSPWRSAGIVADWPGPALKSWFLHNDNLDAYPKRWFGRIASPERVERAFDWYNRYLDRCFAHYDTVVTNGPVLFKRYRARGVRVDAAFPLGIDRHRFSPTLRDESLRASMLAECGLPPDAHLLLAVGRHHPEKRWPMVIDAVQRAGARAPVGMMMLGQGPNTAALERHIGSSPHIRLYHPVYDRPQLATFMASADAFIHGASNETFGLVASEALASGMPLIVPDEGGAFEVAAPAYAETYRAGDAYACSAAILRLLARDQAELRAAAREAAAQVRSDEQHAADLVSFYARRIAERDRQARKSA